MSGGSAPRPGVHHRADQGTDGFFPNVTLYHQNQNPSPAIPHSTPMFPVGIEKLLSEEAVERIWRLHTLWSYPHRFYSRATLHFHDHQPMSPKISQYTRPSGAPCGRRGIKEKVRNVHIVECPGIIRKSPPIHTR